LKSRNCVADDPFHGLVVTASCQHVVENYRPVVPEWLRGERPFYFIIGDELVAAYDIECLLGGGRSFFIIGDELVDASSVISRMGRGSTFSLNHQLPDIDVISFANNIENPSQTVIIKWIASHF